MISYRKNSIRYPFFCLLIVLFFFFIGCSEDQPSKPSTSNIITYAKTFDNEHDEFGLDVLQLDSGDFIFAGNERSQEDFQHSVLIIKTDENGNVLWKKNYSNETYLYIGQIVEAIDGFVFGGVSGEAEPFFMTSIDTAGNEIWHSTFSQNLVVTSNTSLLKTSDGNFLIAGGFESEGLPASGIKLIKVDINGNLINELTLEEEAIYDLGICESGDGGYVLNYELAFGSPLTIVHKIDEQGQTAWRQTYEIENFWTTGLDIFPVSDGGYVITGEAGHDTSFLFLLKIDHTGAIQWAHHYEYESEGYDVKETSDNGFIVTGEINKSNLLLLKTDSEGTFLWRTQYGEKYSSYGKSVIETDDGGLVSIGSTTDAFIGTADFYVIKTDQNGMLYGW